MPNVVAYRAPYPMLNQTLWLLIQLGGEDALPQTLRDTLSAFEPKYAAWERDGTVLLMVAGARSGKLLLALLS